MKTILTVVAVAILAMGFTGCSDGKIKRTHHLEKIDPNDDVPMP